MGSMYIWTTIYVFKNALMDSTRTPTPVNVKPALRVAKPVLVLISRIAIRVDKKITQESLLSSTKLLATQYACSNLVL